MGRKLYEKSRFKQSGDRFNTFELVGEGLPISSVWFEF